MNLTAEFRGPSAGVAEETSVDAFLGSRVEAVQPKRGHHRAGLEAVLIGAALPDTFDGLAVDLGAGAGIAGFCLAARSSSASVVLVEREPELIALAEAALGRDANQAFAKRVQLVQADISAGPLPIEPADAVIMNPPFHHGEGASSPKGEARTRAHILAEEGIDRWFRAAAANLKPGGTLVGIFRADALAEVLAAADRRFGSVDVLAVHPREGHPALRILVRGLKGSRAPLRLLPGLVLHQAEGHGYRREAEEILRNGAALQTAFPIWRPRARPGVA